MRTAAVTASDPFFPNATISAQGIISISIRATSTWIGCGERERRSRGELRGDGFLDRGMAVAEQTGRRHSPSPRTCVRSSRQLIAVGGHGEPGQQLIGVRVGMEALPEAAVLAPLASTGVGIRDESVVGSAGGGSPDLEPRS